MSVFNNMTTVAMLGGGLAAGAYAAKSTYQSDGEIRPGKIIGRGVEGAFLAGLGIYGASKIPGMMKTAGTVADAWKPLGSKMGVKAAPRVSPWKRMGALKESINNIGMEEAPLSIVGKVGTKTPKVWRSAGGAVAGGLAKGVLLPLAAAGIAYKLASGSAEQDVQSRAELVPDGMGGSTYAPQGTYQRGPNTMSGPGRRAKSMNATGDVALGMHRGRHG